MTVATILSSLAPLSTADTVGEALVELAEAHVGNLPVLTPEGTLDSLVAESALRAHPDPDAPLGALVAGEPISIGLDTHVFDAAHLLRQHALSVLPVVTEDAGYAGLVVRQDVFAQLAHMLATEEPGAIVVLDAARDGLLARARWPRSSSRTGSASCPSRRKTTPGRRPRPGHAQAERDRHGARPPRDGPPRLQRRDGRVRRGRQDDLEERAAAFLRYLNV